MNSLDRLQTFSSSRYMAIATPWNNGPLEGHINRLKAIKRQMYGRAGFELLKARVLPWDASDEKETRTCTESACENVLCHPFDVPLASHCHPFDISKKNIGRFVLITLGLCAFGYLVGRFLGY